MMFAAQIFSKQAIVNASTQSDRFGKTSDTEWIAPLYFVNRKSEIDWRQVVLLRNEVRGRVVPHATMWAPFANSLKAWNTALGSDLADRGPAGFTCGVTS